MRAYADLMAFQRDTEALGQISGRLGWDQETVMPKGSAAQRSEEMGAIEGVLHSRRTDPRIGDWLAAAEPQTPQEVAQLRHIAFNYERDQKISAKLATEFAKVTSKAQGIWANARASEDVAAFLPILGEVVTMRREMGQALSHTNDPYDGLVEEFEPGATAASLAEMFDALRPRLVALSDKVRDAGKHPAALDHSFEEASQLLISQRLAQDFGYDLDRGRIDKAVHPFSSGSGHDVRITTRTSLQDPFNCFYSTIHEVGHACYEQNIDDSYLLTPLGRGVSMGVHESQSRIYENQLGRSRAFTNYLYGMMREHFGDFGIPDADAFYRTANRVTPGYIRTEASEVHYNLHVLMRFDLERALLTGDLPLADLESAWNERFEADFGVAVDKPSNGCLQDVHWSVGYIGYFPTYTLGNVYAGCLNAAMARDLPGLEDDLLRGDTSAATSWLTEKVHQFGGLRTPVETIEHATGAPVSPEPLLEYLEEKFSDIYAL